MGDATGRRRGEERRGEVGGSELLPSYIAASCWRCWVGFGFLLFRWLQDVSSFFPTSINQIFSTNKLLIFF